MNAFDLADTAIKIGLGAAVSGIATYKVAKLSHDRDVERQAIVRRLDSLEKASLAFQEYAHAWRRWCGRVAGVLKGRNPPVDKYTPQQRSHMIEVDKEYQKSRERLIVAVAGLHLLGATEAIDALNALTGEISTFRDRVIFRKEVPLIAEFDEFLTKSADKKKAFERELSSLYLSRK